MMELKSLFVGMQEIMNNSFRDMAYEINYNRNFIII